MKGNKEGKRSKTRRRGKEWRELNGRWREVEEGDASGEIIKGNRKERDVRRGGGGGRKRREYRGIFRKVDVRAGVQGGKEGPRWRGDGRKKR